MRVTLAAAIPKGATATSYYESGGRLPVMRIKDEHKPVRRA